MWIKRTLLLALVLGLGAVLAIGGLAIESRLKPEAAWPYGDRTLEVSTVHLEGPGADADGIVRDLRAAYPGMPVLRLDSPGGTILAVGSESGPPDLAAAEEVLARRGVTDTRSGSGTYMQSAPDWFGPDRIGHDAVFAAGALLVSSCLVGWGRSRRKRRAA